jgi:cell division protein FtsW (lipid II flippase)
MNRQSLVKIFAVVFIVVLLLLTCHFFLHGLDKDNGHCLLCELMVTGVVFIEQYELLLASFFIAIIFLIKPIQFTCSSYLKIQLRAPPEQLLKSKPIFI